MSENNSIKNKIISFAALALAIGTVVYANTVAKVIESTEAAAQTSTPVVPISAEQGGVVATQPGIVTSPSPTISTPVSSTPAPAAPVKTPPPVVVKDPVIIPKSKYKDGTYTATGTYAVPEGSEQITVTLTVTNDIVVESSVVNDANEGDSRKYQSRFANSYKVQVVGKDIDDIRLSRVSGSSLTPNGFNAALAKIKTQAIA